MKVSSTQQKFTPFSITIDIESEGEARALYAIFNYGHNASLIGDANGREIQTKIGRKFSTSSDLNNEIYNGINGHDFYKA